MKRRLLRWKRYLGVLAQFWTGEKHWSDYRQIQHMVANGYTDTVTSLSSRREERRDIHREEREREMVEGLAEAARGSTYISSSGEHAVRQVLNRKVAVWGVLHERHCAKPLYRAEKTTTTLLDLKHSSSSSQPVYACVAKRAHVVQPTSHAHLM